MASLLTLFPFEEPQYKPVKEGEAAKAPTHVHFMRQQYGYAQVGLTCGGCFHYTGGRVQSWKPDAAGCRLWEERE